MEHRTRRDLKLLNLITDFEHKFDQGILDYMDEKTLHQLIEYYEGEYNYDKALEVVNIALEQYKYRSDFYIIKARILINDNKLEEGLKFLNKAEIIAPYEREITILKVKVNSMRKDFDAAKALLQELKSFAMKDDYIDILLAESYFYEAKKDYDNMYFSLKKCLQLDYSNREALDRFLVSVELSKNFEDSIAFNNSLIDIQPYNHMAWYNLGLSYYGIWEYDLAVDALEYSFIIDPEFENGYLECAEICIQQNKFEQALSIYLDADEKFGPDQDIMINMATCYLKLDKILEAKVLLLKALKLDNHNDEVYYLLGECFTKNQNWYSAINAYLKAIDLDTEREEYYLGLAKSYVKVEEYNKATVNFNRACRVCNEDATYWKEYASFIIKLGLYEEALIILDEAEEHTFGAELLYCRAITMFFLKEKKKGLDILAEALSEDPSMNHIIFELAPEFEIDQEINSMIKYYCLEYEV